MTASTGSQLRSATSSAILAVSIARAQHRGVHGVGPQAGIGQLLPGPRCLGAAALRQTNVDPAGEQPLVIPLALAVLWIKMSVLMSEIPSRALGVTSRRSLQSVTQTL